MAYVSGPYMILPALAGGLISTSTAVTPGFANIYAYRTTDASSVWQATAYVTDASALGMKKFDLVFVLDTGSTAFHLAMVSAMSSGYATLGLSLSTAYS